MADIVQFRLETHIPELKAIETMGLFTSREVGFIIKKRKAFEYRLQRSLRTKDDYLGYIHYEMCLLKLIKLRKLRLRISKGYKEVEFHIIARIFALFRKVMFSFHSDLKLWLSAIEFGRHVNWQNTVSRLYGRLLHMHSNKPELWVAAAKHEMEQQETVETARQLMLRGLRFLPKSTLLFTEYFRLELQYVHIRRNTTVTWLSKDNNTEDGDPLVEGMLPLVVYKNAVMAIPEAEFAVTLLDVCQSFHFVPKVRKYIYDDIERRFLNEEYGRAALAKRPISDLSDELLDEKESDLKKAISLCYCNFQEAVKDIPTEKMWSMYIEFCLEQKGPDELEHKQHLFSIFGRAAEDECLASDYYHLWANMADIEHRGRVLLLATTRFPQKIEFWKDRVSHELQHNVNDHKAIRKLLDKALNAPCTDVSCIWDVAIQWHMACSSKGLIDIFEKGLAMLSNASARIKIQYLQWIAVNEGIESTRKLYRRIWCMHPIMVDFFYVACDIELNQPQPEFKQIKLIMENACANFGKSDPDLWMRYINVVKQFSSGVGEIGQLHWRAKKTLDPLLVDQFIALYTLMETTVLDF